MAPIQPGTVIAGKYVVEGIIGRGGVGIIAAARHLTLKQLVALKFLRPEVASDSEVRQRFLREAQAAAQIRGEHVARVMDAGVEDGRAFLVFEYLIGRDLAAVLKEEGPLPIADAVDYLTQTCEALAEAHALGIVHRDLKPANLFLTYAPDGAPFVKVLDFGLSKFSPSTPVTVLTADNHVIGSPHFMSPEQMRSSRDADARSDIWALGVVLFGLLTGRVPFEGEFLTEVCAAILGGKPLSLTELRPEAPPELEAVILRCLRTNSAERPASVAELAEALRPFTHAAGQTRAARVARIAQDTRRRLETSSGMSSPNLLAALDEPTRALARPEQPSAITHNSSPASWSLSVSPFAVVNEPSDSVGSHAATNLERTPPRSERAAPAVTQSNRDRGGHAARRRLFTAVAFGSLLVGVAGTWWLGRDRARDLPELASTTVDVATSTVAGHALASPSAIPVSSATRRAEDTETTEAKPVPQLNVRAAAPEKAPARVKGGVAKSAASASAAPPPSVPTTRRAPTTPPDEDLILNLPH